MPAAIDDNRKNEEKQKLKDYMNTMKSLYNLDDAGMARLENVYKKASDDIDKITDEAVLESYVATTMEVMGNVAYAYIGNQNNSSSDNPNIKSDNPDRIINNDDRADADEDLLNYMKSLEVRYRLDEKVMENLRKVFDSAVYYIANTDMTVAELEAYVTSTKGSMESTAVANVSVTTSEFLQVGDNWATPTVSYGQSVAIVLPVINFGTEELNDLIIEPQTSTIVSEWPFVPGRRNPIYRETRPMMRLWRTAGNSPFILRPETT